MALANKNHVMTDSTMAIIQASAFYEHNPQTTIYHHQIDDHQKNIYQEPESPEKPCGLARNFTMSNSSSVSSPSSTSSNGLGYNQQTTNYNLSEEGHSVISFKPDFGNFVHARGPLLSFEQNKRVQRNLFPKMMGEDEYPMWEEELHLNGYQNPNCAATNHGPPESSNSHQTAVSGVEFAWMNDQMANNSIQELGRPEASNNKRPSMGESTQAVKKQCSGSKKQPKEKSLSPAKDPQSLAAKNRRERISERLKVLQDLVPNGSKVDLVTMLEKAISYVKFLQLQVKVLATDEFWPAQGGKAPELSQVREAIDAILATHQRDRNSSSK
ncbi:hypothetical protein BUALT_Bualt04G0089500 [Buddleja alternifolia]|uniref:BHLH domain-containing protein n=1 Tax=Buddleja alternifolia TaxID=168488 RepID=A0AAV6XTX7_9LAMI|nr:hypothetical protein BUALT_Bualt04G0089500 [Buddleja alternifolia]